MILLFAVNPAGAQEAEAQGASASDALEVVIVTARKREESLLEIPESVAAISGADIDRQNLKGLEQIGFQVPNLNLSMRLDGFPNVSIRGLGSFGNTQGVGFYLDDTQIFSDASSRFGDLERVEVLKGPQGTLYGGSNIGGAVKFVSARPDSEAVSGRVKLLGGEQGTMDLEGSVNLPLGDGGWAVRAFAFAAEDDGYLINQNPARVNGMRADNPTNVGAVTESGGRISIAGPLSERLSFYAAMRTNEYEGPNNTWV
ncbi:MAG: TonB-dependent receptor plug domain-containing protein, partial [Gammaproteobacteria bacterium]|nr:TonB-dependent receptor plug domain-containing protein [Gammaproteobacteria bacterium]